MGEKAHFQWFGETLLLQCHVQPGAKSSELAGLHGHRLKIRLKAPPVEGRANDELLKFLARIFAVAKGDVSIVCGVSSRQKTVSIRAPQKLPADLMIDGQDKNSQ